MSILNPGIISVTLDSSRAASENKRMHSGHYLALIRNTTTGVVVSLANVISTELLACPTLRGIQIRVPWRTLEPTDGNYDPSEIDSVLTSLAGMSGNTRRLCILIETKIFNLALHPAPTWLTTDAKYGGGEFEYDGGNGFADGRILRMENAYVQDRLSRLVQYLGARYKDEQLIEMISLQEPSIPTPVGVTIDYAAHNAGMVSLASNLVQCFPRTIVRTMYNYASPLTEDTNATYLASMKSAGVRGFGFPNTSPDQPNFEKTTPYTGVYRQGRAEMGVSVIVPEVQPIDYASTTPEGTGSNPSVQDSLDFLKGMFNPEYIMWTRDASIDAITGNKNFDDVYALLNQSPQTNDIWGGLKHTRPSNIN